jgi:hypothetical protein
MKKLMEFDDFSDSGDILDLNDMERAQIKTWIQKYFIILKKNNIFL